MTQEVLAERAGVGVATIGALEEGRRRRPHLNTLAALADALDLSPDDRAALVAGMPPRVQAPELPVESVISEPLESTAPGYPDLPAPLTPLVGREGDVARTTDLLQQGVRLLTLTGPGGVGKTRLALQVAVVLRGHFADGVAFVPLASLADAKLVQPTVAQVLGLRETGGHPLTELLRRALRDRHLLLVLDNCEHVLAGVTEVTGLLEGCPGLVILATGRSPLRVRGEHEYVVSPLALPAFGQVVSLEEATRSPAVRLFAERARAASPGFALSAANVSAVAAICGRLDGLPLALELAAPRLKLLPASALLTRLHRALPLLTGGARDVPARQQTLRATLAWSYGLLDSKEQALFRRLAVFAGDCTVAAAEDMGAGLESDAVDVLECLGSLVDKSLLHVREQAGEARVGMLETIREFAYEELEASGEETAVRTLHARWMVAAVEEIEPRLSGPEQVPMLTRLATEQPNIRAALGWLLEVGESDGVGRLLRSLIRFWWVRGQMMEARRWADALLAGDPPPLARARASLLAGSAAMLYDADAAEALVLLDEACTLARAQSDRYVEGWSLLVQGMLGPVRGDVAGAIALVRQGQHLFQEIGCEWAVGFCLGNISSLSVLLGRLDEAERCAEEYAALAHRIQDAICVARAADCIAVVALMRQDFERVAAVLDEAIPVALTVGHADVVANGLMGLAVAAARQDPVRAAREFGAAAALREATGGDFWPARRTLYDPAVERVRGALGTATFEAAWREGRTMTREQAAAYALGRDSWAGETLGQAANRAG